MSPRREVNEMSASDDGLRARNQALLIAEYTSDGIAVPTGKPYRNVYIGIWRFRDRRICGIREFFNPALTAEALTPD